MNIAKFIALNLAVGILVTAVLDRAAVSVYAHQVCQFDNTRCKGCGCKGGPGYRGPNNKCVGFKNLTKICGNPPTKRCIFENAPGTGANRECALHKHDKKKNKTRSDIAPTGFEKFSKLPCALRITVYPAPCNP